MLGLEGKTVALLRAHGQGGELKSGLEALGARVLEVPMIAIAPPEDPKPFDDAIRDLRSFDWVALTSPNAVAAFAGALDLEDWRSSLGSTKVASVGPGTTSAARERGLEVELEADDAIQEGLARALVGRGVQGKRVLLPRADQARDVLEKTLRDAGALVMSVVAYRTVEGEGDPSVLLRELDQGSLDAVCFTSASTVRHLARRIGEPVFQARFRGKRPILASMGPIASNALRELGVEPGVEANEHTAVGLVAAVRAALQER